MVYHLLGFCEDWFPLGSVRLILWYLRPIVSKEQPSPFLIAIDQPKSFKF